MVKDGSYTIAAAKSTLPLSAHNAGKTFVVTGATSGIGLALARDLAPVAGRLVIVGRDEARLQAATETAGSVELIPILADLASIEGTRSLAEQLDLLPRIDVLIHNAGVLPAHRRLTADGFEESFAVNHLAPFVLNHRLRKRLVASRPSRIVQVTSGLALAVRVDLDGDPRGVWFEPISTYARTKLWNLHATHALFRAVALPSMPFIQASFERASVRELRAFQASRPGISGSHRKSVLWVLCTSRLLQSWRIRLIVSSIRFEKW